MSDHPEPDRTAAPRAVAAPAARCVRLAETGAPVGSRTGRVRWATVGERSPSHTLRVAAVVTATVGLLAGATAVTLSAIVSAPPESPEVATRRLFDRVVANDVIGVLEILAPEDRAAIRQPLSDIGAQLQRLGLLVRTDGLDVQDLRLTGLKVTVDGLRAKQVPYTSAPASGPTSTSAYTDGLAAVDVTGGRIEVKLEGEPPLLAERAFRLANDVFQADARNGTLTRDFAQYPLRLVTVNTDGGWFVSVPHSLAEAFRSQESHPAGEPAPGVDHERSTGTPASSSGERARAPVMSSAGGGSPEEIVRQLMEALARGDRAGSTAAVAPEEAALVEVSSFLFPELPDQLPDPHRRGSITQLGLTTGGSGNIRRVKVGHLDAVFETDVNRAEIGYDGRCFTAKYLFVGAADPYATYVTCNGEPTSSTIEGITGPAPRDDERSERETETRTRGTLPTRDSFDQPVISEAQELAQLPGRPTDNPFSVMAVFGGGADLPGFTVVDRGGRWYVSPMRTVLDSAVDTLRATAPDQIEEPIDRIDRREQADVDEAILFEARDPDNALFGMAAKKVSPTLPLCFVEVRRTAGGKAGFLLYNDCVEHLVRSGAIDPATVPPSQLFVECVTAEPTSPPALDNPYRRLYLADKASRDCFARHFADIGRANLFDKLSPPLADHLCVAPYLGLEATSPEDDWAAADLAVADCFSRR